jgi:ADP-ribosylation factor related protein 1
VQYYKEAHALVFVVDASDPARLQDSLQAFGTKLGQGFLPLPSRSLCCRSLESVVASPNMESVPVLVLANKSDVAGALDVPQIKEVFNSCAAKVGKRDCKVSRVSAKTGYAG